MSKKGLIGVQMSTIAPAKMPSFEPFEVMSKLVDIGYHCAEISQVPMTKENVAGFRRAIDELNFNVSSMTAAVAPMFPGQPGEYLSNPDDYKKMLDDARTLNCDMFRIGMMPMNAIGSAQKCIDFAKTAEEYALKLKEDGILVRWFDADRIRDYVRITIGSLEQMASLVDEIARLLEDM